VHADFRGGRADRGPLTWGQRAIWDAIARNPPGYFNIARAMMVPRSGGADLDEVARAVGTVVERHESLRTHVLIEAEPVQVIRASGRIELHIAEAPPDGAADAAQSLLAALAAPGFDLSAEWPMRVGVVTSGGLARYIALVLSHIAADSAGAEIVMRDLRRLLRRGVAAGRPPAQPLDLARRQRADERRTRAAVEFWTRQFTRIPHVMFTPLHEVRGSPYRRVQLTSEALRTAARLVAAGHQTSTSTVLLTATAAQVGERTGHRAVALSTIVGNRFSGEVRDMVTTLDQLGLFTLDVGPGLRDLVPVARAAALRAYRYAYYDQPEMDQALTRMGRERGVELNPYACFNDLRLTEDPADAMAVDVPPGLDADDIRKSVDRSVIEELPDPGGIRCRFCVQVHSGPEVLVLQLTADTRCLPYDEMVGFLRDLESAVIEAALEEL
jgi:hypothetical protein